MPLYRLTLPVCDLDGTRYSLYGERDLHFHPVPGCHLECDFLDHLVVRESSFDVDGGQGSVRFHEVCIKRGDFTNGKSLKENEGYLAEKEWEVEPTG